MGEDVRFLGVVYDDDEARVQEFLQERGSAYPSLLDEGGRTAIAYGVAGVPETFFIDRLGADRREVRGASRLSHHREARVPGPRATCDEAASSSFSCVAAPGAWAQETAKPVVADPALVVGAPKDAPLSGSALETRTEDVAALLRCPVCQGLSVADSPATMAQNMKAEVRALLAKGYAEDQVLAYFERSYGEFVRLEPPLARRELAGLARPPRRSPGRGRRGGPRPAARPAAGRVGGVHGRRPPRRETLPDDPRLAAAVLRVRELAYGWPLGKPPGPAAS